jgi:hypothetical protein
MKMMLICSANPPLCSSMLPLEQDGVYEILPILINQKTSDEQMQVPVTTLWYIWKARNDKRFNNKTWMVWQVHNAMTADIKVNLLQKEQEPDQQATEQQPHQHDAFGAHNLHQSNKGMFPSNAGTSNSTQAAQPQGTRSTNDHPHRKLIGNSTAPTPPLYRSMLPALLPGTRCYSDASIDPDQNSPSSRRANLGVFIINTQAHPAQSIYIQGMISNATSVLMAEAAALALAAMVASLLNLCPPNYLTCQQPVTFFNGSNHSSPPDWTIKVFNQKFINFNSGNRE